MPPPYSPAAGSGMRALLAHLLVEGVRHLEQHAGAVAGVDLAAAGATVVEVLQDLDGLLEDAVGLAPLDVDHEADAAGVVLELRVVEPLLGGAGRGGAMLACSSVQACLRFEKRRSGARPGSGNRWRRAPHAENDRIVDTESI